MDGIIEIIMEIIMEAGIETTGNKKVPKVLRYTLMALIIAFFLFMASLLIIGGIRVLNENKWAGLFLIGIGGFLLFFIFLKFRNKF